MRVRVDNGKYTFITGDHLTGAAVDVLRDGEPWLTLHDGSKALRALMAELDAARVVVEAARLAVRYEHDGGDSLAAMVIVKAALEKHAALVDDNEPPSEWAK